MLKYRSKMAILTYGSASIIFFLIGYFVRGLGVIPQPQTVETTPGAAAHQTQVLLAPTPNVVENISKYFPNKDVWDAESSFETTMRSCLGSFCFDDPVKTAEQKDIVRVGLLMADSIGAQTLQNMLLAGGLPVSTSLELIYASNVPPYGYGKNHGWSRIIRIANHVIPHSVRLLAATPSTADVSSIEKLVTSQVKQLMRWHCRLSHVAAHTALLTVYADQLIAKPVTELEKMLTFAGHKPNRDSLLGAIKTHLPTLTAEWDDLATIRNHFGNLTSSSGAAVDIEAIFTKAVAAVQKEMVESQNLTKWPCKSFRDFKDKSVIEQLPLPVKSLAADCSAKHVKCSVRYDSEEHKRNTQQSAN